MKITQEGNLQHIIADDGKVLVNKGDYETDAENAYRFKEAFLAECDSVDNYIEIELTKE